LILAHGPWPQPWRADPSNRVSGQPAAIELGRRLFYDGDLSWDGTMSCATCHEQKRGFTDPNKTRAGFDGQPGERNIQTLANVGWFKSLTWGGPQVDTLEHQALIPIQGLVPVEMGFAGRPEGLLAQRLKDQACYPELFAAAFPERGGKIDMDTITLALSAFQRSLVSLDAPYDQYRRGDKAAISGKAKRGEALFAEKQCASCHAGPHFTDAALPGVKAKDAFHRLAAPKDGKDAGLSRITQKPEDAGRFRTPGLRNVALSAPYMHDGEAATLPEAIRHHYADAETVDPRLKLAVSDQEMSDLVAFLEALTDRGFVSDARFARPGAACPVSADALAAAEAENARRQHNSVEGP
ncbi:MAG: cytochrome c peroxidase, partial [Hyphomonadaceae bacterium]